MSQHLDKLVEELSQLTVIDMAKLKELLEKKWGVTAAVAAAPGAAAPAAAAAAESTEYKVILEAPIPDDKKIGVIKAVREVTGLGLKEAKDMVEGAPKDLKASCSKAEAEEIQKKITAAGGKVTLKGL